MSRLAWTDTCRLLHSPFHWSGAPVTYPHSSLNWKTSNGHLPHRPLAWMANTCHLQRRPFSVAPYTCESPCHHLPSQQARLLACRAPCASGHCTEPPCFKLHPMSVRAQAAEHAAHTPRLQCPATPHAHTPCPAAHTHRLHRTVQFATRVVGYTAVRTLNATHAHATPFPQT